MTKEQAREATPCGVEEERLEEEVQELKVLNEHLRNRIGEKNDRIRRLTRLGLVTCEPKHRELWEQEEEL